MRKRFYFLKKPKVRQSWNKYNLYNLARLSLLSARDLTFFQQKWAAKSATRAYHGEQVKEKQWHNLFTTRLPAVVPVDHRYLAQNDGSEQSSGRGSGLDTKAGGRRAPARLRTPYEQMVYHPMERRLDVAIFRALFASSTRQARQFVVHGAVKVNGKKMVHPGYLLNPGDMFQVEPERVMYATGANKDAIKYRRMAGPRARNSLRPQWLEDIDVEFDSEGRLVNKRATSNTQRQSPSSSKASDAEDKESGAKIASQAEAPPLPSPKTALRVLQQRALSLLSDPLKSVSARRKQDLRAFKRTLRSTLSILGKAPEPAAKVDDLRSQLDAIIAKIEADATGGSEFGSRDSGSSDTSSIVPESKVGNDNNDGAAAQTQASASASINHYKKPNKSNKIDDSYDIRSAYRNPDDPDGPVLTLREALDAIRENPPDKLKPYATPWRPRDYMSAFAYIPRYLEVNQRICSAVYLRHPVARPGLAEVPTPFHPETSQLAFTWYLRRR